MREPLCNIDREINLMIAFGDGQLHIPPYFDAFLEPNVDVDEDGHIVIGCTECRTPVRLDAQIDGEVLDGSTRTIVTLFAVEESVITASWDQVLCARCTAIARGVAA